VPCRVLHVSTSGYYEWRDRGTSARALADAHLIRTLRAVHAGSRQSHGVRRCHTELRLGLRLRVGRKRVWRLLRLARLQGVHRVAATLNNRPRKTPRLEDPSRAELANAIFEWIEAFYIPTRRHSALGYLSSVPTKPFTPQHPLRLDHHTETVRRTGNRSRRRREDRVQSVRTVTRTAWVATLTWRTSR
jgi:helix-turn-helix protein